jgi:PAS domain S-box-containing protein
VNSDPSIPASPAPAALRKRLLVVDDERIVAEDIAECLEAMGCEVLGIAITGEQAIAMAGEHQPDLVLMDICLQGHIDGIEAALAIRDRWQIPVVFLTAYSDPGVLQRAKQAGPLGYIVKPFDEASLRTTIELALHRCDLERALRDNREWFVTILTSMEDGVVVADVQARVCFMNPAAERLTGWDSLRVAGQPTAHVCPIYHAETGHQCAHPVLAALVGDTASLDTQEQLLLRADHSLLPVDVSAGVVRDRVGTITGVVLILRDVTEAHRTTQELRHHRQHLEALVAERTRRLTDANARLLGEIEDRKRAEASLATRARLESLVNAISADFLALPPSECSPATTQALARIGQAVGSDAVCLYLLHDARPEISCAHEWCGPGVTPRRASFQGWPHAGDPGRRDLLRHPAPHGHDPGLAATIAEARQMPSVLMAPLIEQDRLLGYLSLEAASHRVWDAEATDLLLMTVGPFAHTLHRYRADRERRRLEEQLARAQRMEAVGRLSGGIAHDFNNTLLPIIGYADLLLSRLPDDDTTTLELTEIRRAAQHAAALTRQLLSFSKKQVVNKVVMNLNDELSTMGNLLQRIIGEDVTLETSLAEGLPAILADPGQIQQVVMNLVVNAREAMPAGGRVTLRTSLARPAALTSEAAPASVPPPLVQLTVEDTGRGIPEDIRDRIFDPFFSTKGHEGSGLGLSVIFSILEHHGGSIDFETEVGRGTAFHVFLPATTLPGREAPAAAETPKDSLPQGHGQRILLIEDELAVNRFVTTALSRHGYEVLSADCVNAAWSTFEREQGRFDMVFSDAILPDGNGVDLISRVLGECPGMRTLLSSGYLDKDALLRLARERDISFLQKPYTLPDLLRTVDDVLHDKRQAVLN